MVLDLSIREGKDSPSFSEGRNEKNKNGVFTIYSNGRDLFGYIIEFEIG